MRFFVVFFSSFTFWLWCAVFRQFYLTCMQSEQILGISDSTLSWKRESFRTCHMRTRFIRCFGVSFLKWALQAIKTDLHTHMEEIDPKFTCAMINMFQMLTVGDETTITTELRGDDGGKCWNHETENKQNTILHVDRPHTLATHKTRKRFSMLSILLHNSDGVLFSLPTHVRPTKTKFQPFCGATDCVLCVLVGVWTLSCVFYGVL